MTFLQPFILWSLPLALLPVLIHLINRMRHRSMPWAAMMFLIASRRSSTRMQQLRQILVLCCRVLAVLGLVLALSRPLAGGWMGWIFAPAPDAILVLLDRSASMESSSSMGSPSKRIRALQILSRTAAEFSHSSRLVLIENVQRTPQDLANGSDLAGLSLTGPTDTAADLPSMMQSAVDWLNENRPGASEIWIASDLQRSNWRAESERWPALGASLAAMPHRVRVRLLALGEESGPDAAVSIPEIIRKQRGNESELELVMDLQRSEGMKGPLPLTVTLDGARSQLEVNMEGQSLRFHHKFTLGDKPGGWGKIELPADANPRNNTAYFVYPAETSAKVGLVSQDSESRRILQLAAAPSPKEMNQTCERLSSSKLNEGSLEGVSMLIWQELLPREENAKLIRDFVNQGGSIVFFPTGQFPEEGDSIGIKGPPEIFGMSWGKVEVAPKDRPFRIAHWDESDGPLAKTEEGMSLPLSDLEIQQRQEIMGGKNSTAVFEGGSPFLSRRQEGKGQAFFCGSLPRKEWSNLGEGSVLVPLLQRLVRMGGIRLNSASSYSCGEWKGMDASEQWVSVDSSTPKDIHFQAGVYRGGGRLIAVNRPKEEDDREILAPHEVRSLFKEVPFSLFEEKQARAGPPEGEMWRFFLVSMLLFLLAEGLLILPEPTREKNEIRNF